MARKRSFASIEQLPSKRWRVRLHRTGRRDPQGTPHLRHPPPGRAYAISVRRINRPGSLDATDDNPPEQLTFGVYAARWLADRQGGRQTHQGPHPRALPGHPGRSPAGHLRPPSARGDQAERRPRVVRGHSDRPPNHAQPRILATADHHGLGGGLMGTSTATRAASSVPGGPSGSTRSGRPVSPNSRR